LARGFSEEEIKSLRDLAEELKKGEAFVHPVKIDSRLYQTVAKMIKDRARPSKKTPPPLPPKVAG